MVARYLNSFKKGLRALSFMKLTKSNVAHNGVSFAVQYTSKDDRDLQKIVTSLEGLPSYGFSVIPFSHELLDTEDIPTDEIVIPFAGTNIAKMFKDGELPHNWLVFYDETNFDQMHYGPILGDRLLNCYGDYHRLGDIREVRYGVDRFIKPVNDLKTFAGVVVPEQTSLDDALALMQHQELDDDEMVVVAPWQNLGREFRVIVAYDKIVGISQYKNVNNVIEHKKTLPHQNIRIAVEWCNIHSKYKPSDVYTIDFVEVEGKLKVVEYNCFNCSGLYEMDRAAVYYAVHQGVGDFVSPKYLN